jgi:hypothetical protein
VPRTTLAKVAESAAYKYLPPQMDLTFYGSTNLQVHFTWWPHRVVGASLDNSRLPYASRVEYNGEVMNLHTFWDRILKEDPLASTLEHMMDYTVLDNKHNLYDVLTWSSQDVKCLSLPYQNSSEGGTRLFQTFPLLPEVMRLVFQLSENCTPFHFRLFHKKHAMELSPPNPYYWATARLTETGESIPLSTFWVETLGWSPATETLADTFRSTFLANHPVSLYEVLMNWTPEEIASLVTDTF